MRTIHTMLSMVLCTWNNHRSHVIKSTDFGLLFVAILPWYKQTFTINKHSQTFTPSDKYRIYLYFFLFYVFYCVLFNYTDLTLGFFCRDIVTIWRIPSLALINTEYIFIFVVLCVLLCVVFLHRSTTETKYIFSILGPSPVVPCKAERQ